MKGIRTLALLVVPAATAVASGGARAQGAAVGMAGSYSLAARGADSPSWNPASLAWSRGTHVRLASLRAVFSNNSFSWDDYRRWNGGTWDEATKREILDRIPAAGLEGRARASLLAPGVSVGAWAVTAEIRGGGHAAVPKDFARLVLFGNTPEESFRLDGSSGSGILLSEFRISHGRTLGRGHGWEVAAGGSVKLLRGWAYAEVSEAEGMLVTTTEAITGYGYVEELTSTGGSGMALDFGAAARNDDGWSAGVVLRHLFGNILWSRETAWYRQTVEADSIRLEDVEEDEDVILEETLDGSAPSFRRSLAPVLITGVSGTFGRTLVEFAWEQGLRSGPVTTTTPRISLGAARGLWRWFEGRTGIAAGGSDGPLVSMGLGVRLGGFEMDAAYYATGTFNPLSGKGAGIGFSLGYRSGEDASGESRVARGIGSARRSP